jgi:NAD(P)-dependent dehydrogenase (short-subunit alcohol dehydrogenase family)
VIPFPAKKYQVSVILYKKSMKTAIVTGAAGNLGQAVVKKFLLKGYSVIGTVIPDESSIIQSHGQHFETAVVDLLNEELSQHFIELVTVKHKIIDVAVLTVGGFTMGDILATKTAEISRQFRLNFETAYNVARPVFRQMLNQGHGRIFLIGARPGANMQNSTGMVAYGLSKSLIFRLAELMNEEAKEQDIVTSVVVPSTIDTPQNRLSMPKADYTKWVTPEAIADIIYFHTSEEGGILRESVIKVYGGS